MTSKIAIALVVVILVGCGTVKTPVKMAYWEGYQQGLADAKEGLWKRHQIIDGVAEAEAFYKGYQAGNSAGCKKKDKRRKRNN